MNKILLPKYKFNRVFVNILSTFVILAMAFPAAGVGYASPASTDMNTLLAAAQAEGSLTVIALPDNWCNFGDVINGFTTQYGIPVNSVSPSASSEEELQAIRDGIQNPSPDTPDVIDVGPGFAMQAKSEGLVAPYQVSTWDTIPDLMKDTDGYWYGDYYGVMSLAANTNVSAPPASWNDLAAGENVGPVALGGDPTSSNLGFFSVYAAALANGGSLDNIEPGLQFFRGLHESGRLLDVIGNEGTLASGETPVLPEWSYLALAQRDANPDAQIEVAVPANSVASFYAQAINAYAPHPNAARLWMEYLYSDEVQLMWLDGYCHPSRFDDLLSRGVIPDDLLARLPDITGAVFPSLDQITNAQAFVEANWNCIVYGDGCSPGSHVGIVLPSANERWLRDAAELENDLQAAGVEPEILFSEEDAGTELANVETLISHGIQVLVIGPVDASATAAVEAARGAGVKVISYDRLIRDTDAVDFYVTFDGIEVGRAMGQYIIDHAQGSGNPLYLYAGALWDNNSYLFFEGAWNVLQPRIDDGTFVIKNSSEAVNLQGNPTLTRDEQSAILSQITTNWSHDDAMNLAAANLSAVGAADKGNVFILAPNDDTARAIGDTFSADQDVTSYILIGQDAEKESIQYIIYGKQSMTVFKDLRTLASDAAGAAITFLQGNTPESDKTYNNGMIDVPARVSDVVVVDRNNIRSTLIDTGYYQSSDFIWRDDFQGPLTEGWYWVNENEEKWEFNNGSLRIYASPYGAGGENLLLRPVAQGDFMIKTHLVFEPDTNFQIAGLVIWQDDQNFLQLGRAFCDIEGSCVGNGLYFDRASGGEAVDGNFATSIGNPSDVFLRLERRGDMVRAFYSVDAGISWYEIGTHWIPSDFQVNGVGLTASQDTNTHDQDLPADFDFFELTEGWGFLPEGFHDGEQGDVPSWACNANGWATDPDDRIADVNVEIVVDDQTVATLPAGEFRQDLADANVCVDGNCSFSTSLWGVISSYEPHRVDAWAQDDTGEWVLLNNSAKTLTCRTYDIYTYDPTTGTTKEITNLRDTHEFNPRWSPDAKMIVHDTWNTDWSSHGVYITDVNTGVSSPLAGAEGGSYPTWSPSGRWIAFDRGADNDYRLFIVRPTGGAPRLVVEDAFMATWSPRSNRLAFQRPSDGGIWTADLDGENQTKVVERGNGPAWSPDGEWIAFEVDGDVWKVRVNNSGNALADPIQMTSSPAWEGRPTWSYDSKTIAFHAGMGQDTDIWTIPAAGGTPTWLTGASIFGDYDANYSLKGQSNFISYSSFSPDGQAARSWVSAYTYDAGTWSVGGHNYHFEATWNGGSETTDEISFNVSDEAQPYAGYALLRPGAVRVGADCAAVDTISPAQSTRFLSGYLTDNPMMYSDAQAYFDSLSANAVWDDGQSAELGRHEIIPFNETDWFNYVCNFTEAPPKMDLRVNYGHDWVESFYEGGHTVSIQVTDSEGNVKATAEVVTEPKDFWGGQTGFQTTPENWSPAPPDLQPYDWVSAQVDNGATAKVQLGDISGQIDLQNNSIEGTINAPWFSDAVQVECLDWGSGQEPPFNNKDAGFVSANGNEPYFCSWDGEWDIQYYQNVGVGYLGPDSHWVANAFYVPNPRIVVQITDDWFRAENFTPNGQLTFWIYDAVGGQLLRHPETTWQLDGSGYVTISMWELEEFIDLVPGQYLVASDGTLTKELALEAFTFDVFDTTTGHLAGTAPEPFERPVWVGIGFQDNAWTMDVTTDLSGNWSADFGAPGDYQWVAAQIFDADGDASELRPSLILP